MGAVGGSVVCGGWWLGATHSYKYIHVITQGPCLLPTDAVGIGTRLSSRYRSFLSYVLLPPVRRASGYALRVIRSTYNYKNSVLKSVNPPVRGDTENSMNPIFEVLFSNNLNPIRYVSFSSELKIVHLSFHVISS